MKRATVLSGIGFAIIASLFSFLSLNIFPLLFGRHAAILLLLTAITFAYLIYLLHNSDTRQGRMLTMAIWLGINVLAWFTGQDVITLASLQIVTIWLVRSLYFHSTIRAALIDLILTTMASGAALWTLAQSGSLSAAVWSFFLCQSLFVVIPQAPGVKNRRDDFDLDGIDRFQAAHRVAQEAVRKLSTH